jgi:replicative DNA helicase
LALNAIVTEAEKRVLAAILAQNDLFEAVEDLGIQPEDFGNEAHRLVWSGLTTLREAKQPLNHHTLGDQLRGHRDKVSQDLLRGLVALGVSEAGTLADAAIVLRDGIRRQVVSYATNLVVKANEAPEETQSPGDHLDAIIAEAETRIGEIALRTEHKPERPFADVANDMINRINRKEARGVPTGFNAIDDYFAGFKPGHLSVLAARSSRGKTALATNIALNALKTGQPVAFLTLEMTYDDEMVQRFVACEAGVNLLHAAQSGWYPGDEEKAWAASALLSQLPLRIRYRPLLTPRQLRLECRRAAREIGPLKLLIVDYLGLMKGDRHENQRFIEIGNIVVQLKAMAGEFQIPILLLCQINREAAQELSPPGLSTLRDTGTLEEHADDVFVIWQKPDSEQKSGPFWTDMQVVIRKQRNGPQDAECNLQFRKGWGRFRDWVEEAPQ